MGFVAVFNSVSKDNLKFLFLWQSFGHRIFELYLSLLHFLHTLEIRYCHLYSIYRHQYLNTHTPSPDGLFGSSFYILLSECLPNTLQIGFDLYGASRTPWGGNSHLSYIYMYSTILCGCYLKTRNVSHHHTYRTT